MSPKYAVDRLETLADVALLAMIPGSEDHLGHDSVGEVLLGDDWQPISFGDVIYVAANDVHQFRAVADEPFGFLCVVDAKRDRPRPRPV